jgi:hypothetical protein
MSFDRSSAVDEAPDSQRPTDQPRCSRPTSRILVSWHVPGCRLGMSGSQRSGKHGMLPIRNMGRTRGDARLWSQQRSAQALPAGEGC